MHGDMFEDMEGKQCYLTFLVPVVAAAFHRVGSADDGAVRRSPLPRVLLTARQELVACRGPKTVAAAALKGTHRHRQPRLQVLS